MHERITEWAVRVVDGDRVHILRCPSEENARQAAGQYEGEPVSREVIATPWEVRPLRPPARIQRQRTKGWRMPHDAVYVGRGSKYGNPFRVVVDCEFLGEQLYRVDAAEDAKFRAFLGGGQVRADAHTWAVTLYRQHLTKAEVDLAPLRGRDLACWCPPHLACHADVLLEMANAAPATQTESRAA